MKRTAFGSEPEKHAPSEQPGHAAPFVSVVIPVYNEVGLIRPAVVDLVDRLEQLVERRRRSDVPRLASRSYEIILAENGSTDGTLDAIDQLVERFPTLRLVRHPTPNYGAALRDGIRSARGTFVVCDEIDLCDVNFYDRAIEILERDDADLVVGSKLMRGAADARPMYRKAASRVLNGMLRVSVGFKGTDTHGLKAFRRERLVPIVEECVVDRDLFASELVVRAWRSTLRVREIPVSVVEMREPSVRLTRRVPAVLRGMVRLVVAIRTNG